MKYNFGWNDRELLVVDALPILPPFIELTPKIQTILFLVIQFFYITQLGIGIILRYISDISL